MAPEKDDFEALPFYQPFTQHLMINTLLALYRIQVLKRCDAHCVLHGFERDQDPLIPVSSPIVLLPEQSEQAKQLYAPLGERPARILSIIPGQLGDPLKGELRVIDASGPSGVVFNDDRTEVDYEALSYCWGPPDFTRFIICSGIVYPVTEHLYIILQRLRDPAQVRHLWIDALCINQYDTSERSKQVGNMPSIYSRARKVLVWLGEHGEYTQALLHCIVPGRKHYFNIQPLLYINVKSPPWDPADWLFYTQTSRPIFLSGDRFVRTCRYHFFSLFQGALDLLSRPWFDRVWVKQEVWAARVVEFRCGNGSAEWTDLRGFGRSLYMFCQNVYTTLLNPIPNSFARFRWKEDETHGSMMGEVESMQRFKSDENFQKNPPPNDLLYLDSSFEFSSATKFLVNEQYHGIVEDDFELLQVLQRTAGSKCSDKRDAVFGVLGMTSDSQRASPFLKVDYDRSVAQIYQDVARYCIQRDEHLDILALRHSWQDEVREDVDGEQLPSWCPNWNRDFSLSLPMVRDRSVRVDDLFLHGRRVPADMASPWWVLRVFGFQVSRIQKARRQFFFPMGVSYAIEKPPLETAIDQISRKFLFKPGNFFARLRAALSRPALLTSTRYTASFLENSPGDFPARDDSIVAAEGCPCLLVLRPTSLDGSDGMTYRIVGIMAQQNLSNTMGLYGAVSKQRFVGTDMTILGDLKSFWDEARRTDESLMTFDLV